MMGNLFVRSIIPGSEVHEKNIKKREKEKGRKRVGGNRAFVAVAFR